MALKLESPLVLSANIASAAMPSLQLLCPIPMANVNLAQSLLESASFNSAGFPASEEEYLFDKEAAQFELLPAPLSVPHDDTAQPANPPLGNDNYLWLVSARGHARLEDGIAPTTQAVCVRITLPMPGSDDS